MGIKKLRPTYISRNKSITPPYTSWCKFAQLIILNGGCNRKRLFFCSKAMKGQHERSSGNLFLITLETCRFISKGKASFFPFHSNNILERLEDTDFQSLQKYI